MDAIEPSVLVQIGYNDLQELYQKIPKFEQLFRLIIQNAFVASQKRIISTFSGNAEERYLDFRNRYPNIGRRVPVREEEFFRKVTEVRKAIPLNVAVGKTCTMVEWHFDYTHEDWGIRNYRQVSVQEWKDGKIIKETFYYGN